MTGLFSSFKTPLKKINKKSLKNKKFKLLVNI